MTVVGSGGVRIARWVKDDRFQKQYRKLPSDLRARIDSKLIDLTKDPMPPGLRFEKLSGYRNPYLYSFHVTGNYKVTLSIEGDCAYLRRVSNHDTIDRAP